MTRAHIIDALKKKMVLQAWVMKTFRERTPALLASARRLIFPLIPQIWDKRSAIDSFFFLPFCPQSPLLPSIRSDWCSCFLILTLLSRKEKWFLSCASFFALLPVEIASYVRNLFICASNPRAKNRFCVVAAENARPASATDAASVLASGGEETNGTSCEIRHLETDWVW